MSKEAPFDVWDGEELGLNGEVGEVAAEEEAMHLDPESEPGPEGGPHWSDLTEGDDGIDRDATVSYFPDEHPEIVPAGNGNGSHGPNDEREPDLEELLERQHYAFPSGSG